MYLEELTSYKQKFLRTICGDEQFFKLMDTKDADVECGDDLMYKQVYPYGYVPDIQNEKKTYLCIDVEVPRVSSRLWKDVGLHVFIFAHKNLMKTDKGTRIDLLAERVDKLVNDDKQYGFGLGLVSVKRFMPVEDYYGVELYYEALDFNSGVNGNARK